MSKVNLSDLATDINVVTRVNSNNAIIEAAFDNTLSRDGTSPNTMLADLDMNSKHILNLPTPATANEPARLVDLTGVTLLSQALPSQVSQSGKSLTTNGTNLSWSNLAPYFPQSAAELSAGITPSNTGIYYGIFERYGAVGDNVTNDFTAITNAVAQSAQTGGVRARPLGDRTYFISNNTLVLPANSSIDISGSNLRTTAITAITFGIGSELFGLDSTITAAGGSGAVLKLTNQAVPGYFGIFGWPFITASSIVAGSIGLDFTGGYKGIFEVQIDEKFLTCITGGSGSITPQTYYNEFRSPRVRIAASGTGIQARNGCNSLVIINPQISGANVGTFGLDFNQSGSVIVVGGYVEAFAAANGTRGCRITDCTNITLNGVTFDQTNVDATTSQALEVAGTSTQINFYGNGFGGSWGSSNRILTKSGAGLFNFIGGAPTNQVCIIGNSTWAGGYLNGFTQVRDITCETITASDSVAAGFAFTFANTNDGQCASFSNNSSSKVAGRSALTINRVGGPGYAINFEDNGVEKGGIVFCTGTPEAQITAVVGTLALRTDGGAATTLYIKESGAGNTGWVAK